MSERERMGSSAILSWSVAACTPVACEKDSGKVFIDCSSVLSNPKCKCSSAYDSRSSGAGNRKKIARTVLLKATRSHISSGLSARGFNTLSSSNSEFVGNGFSSLFGFGNDALLVRRCKSNSSAHSGNHPLLFLYIFFSFGILVFLGREAVFYLMYAERGRFDKVKSFSF